LIISIKSFVSQSVQSPTEIVQVQNAVKRPVATSVSFGFLPLELHLVKFVGELLQFAAAGVAQIFTEGEHDDRPANIKQEAIIKPPPLKT